MKKRRSKSPAIVGALVFLGLLALVVFIPEIQAYLTPADEGANQVDAYRKTVLQAIGGLVVAVGLYLTYRRVKVTEDGQVTERFTRAIEHLGDERMAVRLGGIYALGRIAEDSNRDHQTVVEVVSAFIRDKVPRDPSSVDPFAERNALSAKGKPGDSREARVAATLDELFAELEEGPIPEIEPDVQAALTTLGRVGTPVTGQRIDLRRTVLARAYLREADFSEARFRGADLRMVDFIRANLAKADLRGADLRGVQFSGASLKWAWFDRETIVDEDGLEQAASLHPSGSLARRAGTS